MGSAVIHPLIRRHAQDAAFYWQQFDTSSASVHLTWPRLQHFGGLLDAHLEGLEVAGTAGWDMAWQALQRWATPSESFVCAHLAIQRRDAAGVAQLLAAAQQRPERLLRGLIPAVSWVGGQVADALIGHWAALPDVEVARVAAFRAAALLGPLHASAASPAWPGAMQDPSAHVRAAACRAAVWFTQSPSGLLPRALVDPDVAVRAEAAIALAQHVNVEDMPALPEVLWACVQHQCAMAAQSTGWFRAQALRRLSRWVRHLAWIQPLGQDGLPAMLRALPPRVALELTLHHGDAAHLPFVIQHMQAPEHARYAGWVWQTITGVDLTASGLAMPVALNSQEARPASQRLTGPELDMGMPFPNAAAVVSAQAELTLPQRHRLMLGQPITVSLLHALLNDAPQALRAMAAHALRYGVPDHPVDVRGPTSRQTAQMQALQMQNSRLAEQAEAAT